MTLGMDMGMGLGIGLSDRRVRAEVRIPSLTRDFARANLTCRAHNNNITEPLSTTITLDLYLRPATVQIKAPKAPLQEGKATQIKCVSSGSYPSAVVSWEITQAGDSRLLPAKAHTIGDATTSILEFVPEARDHGATLACRAHNPNISGKGIRMYAVLQVHFSPRVKLRLGANLQGKSITEGEDLYFECEVACNPPMEEIVWYKDGERVHPNPKGGVLISSKNLVLQMVRRTSAGNYTCAAENSLGATTSNVVLLSIRLAFNLLSNIPNELFLVPSQENHSLSADKNVVNLPHPVPQHLLSQRDPQPTSLAGSWYGARGVSTRRWVMALYLWGPLLLRDPPHFSLGPQDLPVCVGGPQAVAVAEGEDVRLTCEVDAQPEDNLHFTWYFNNTLDTVEVERHRIEVRPGHSFLDYTPRSSRDYGTLSCWATNEVGTQADPCRFTVVEAGPPERVGNCMLVNLTVSTLEVECTPGSDGGLQQKFVARVYAAPTHTLVATLEEDTPRFCVGGLTPGQDYLITITAVNAKGSSDPEEIDAVRLKS
ncbi:nephrin-like [Penaeus chinensis]|uniref:nephrin-like n=1 Tax=Penaeus chinensis TaxID=139456 RepID=UPI001FB7B4CB|nr:nephrin-like [Penaeus chinensis]